MEGLQQAYPHSPVEAMLCYGPVSPHVAGMCVFAPCSEPVLHIKPHVVLSDGSPIHLDCMHSAAANYSTNNIPVHRFSTGGCLPIPVTCVTVTSATGEL